jgi:hypothetical protein
LQPFSKRSHTPEPQVLGTGDYESIGPAIPPASRAPVFHRSAPPPPPSQQPYGMYAPHGGYGQQMLAAPPPPHSLAPVAMNAAMGTGRHQANSTGPHRNADTITIRERPGMKAGFVLVVLGALVGGVLGVGMRARQNQVEASNAAQQAPAQPVATNAAGPATAQTPPALPPSAMANLPPGTVLVDPSKPGNVIPVQPPIVVTPKAEDKKDATADKDKDKDKDKDAKVATGKKPHFGGGHKHAAKPVEDDDDKPPRPAPAATPRISTKVSPPKEREPDAPPPPKPEKPAESKPKDKSAEQVLKDAMKESY